MTTDYSSASDLLRRPQNFQWYHWNSASNDSCFTNKEDWIKYADIDNEIIEDAYQAKKYMVEIDGGFVLDIKNMVEVTSSTQQTQIKRVQLDQDRRNAHLRAERFTSLPVVATTFTPLTTPINDEEDLAVNNDDVLPLLRPSNIVDAYIVQEVKKNNKTITNIIEDAAQGVIEEGRAHGKLHQAEWLAQKLWNLIQSGAASKAEDTGHRPPPIIGQTAVHLYSRDSFWYKLVNHVLRNPHTNAKKQVKAIGSFVYLLNMYFDGGFRSTDFSTVYRGLTMTHEEREEFINKEDGIIEFQAFISTSKNRELAEWFGDTLLIIDLSPELTSWRTRMMNWKRYSGADISNVSIFPEEEEFLMYPRSAKFKIVRYEYDSNKQKHLIYIKYLDTSKAPPGFSDGIQNASS
ncbi:unnamed protein product [Rotaria magnacalcarata]|uniref:NAD(P)(+)--arginine ADP-ribosyltransferase n=1 Tax=Rotaria magnacalcarata TaxID=392030 RepID=A0A817AI60_9BILA|nr:unnamed protein product [Rotaria magnacalcarata]CAF2252966.1 unnamed protein product [Rotaria magnacalcarata]CAF4062867.1 unnamed protein product [Rotaria magnacalcarata]CAF4138224.1 unnamed protein product [Rotaria magnacalcarata]